MRVVTAVVTCLWMLVVFWLHWNLFLAIQGDWQSAKAVAHEMPEYRAMFRFVLGYRMMFYALPLAFISAPAIFAMGMVLQLPRLGAALALSYSAAVILTLLVL